MITDLRINSSRLRADFDELAETGATISGGVSRLALSNEDLEARAWFANKIEEAELRVHDDDAGNLSGVYYCPDLGAQTLLVGSHLDTVPNGGRFDGTVGVLGALECIRMIREAGIKLPFHLEVIDFTDEEGNWQGLFGSMGLTGHLSAEHINDALEDHGPFRAALFRAGIRPIDVIRARRDPHSLRAYLELHIEQGPRLERLQKHIGVVNRIVGRATYQVTFYGEAAHAATTIRTERRDALLGAARFIIDAQEKIPQLYRDGIFNCGNAEVKPGSFNIIPAETRLTVEVRHPEQHILSQMEDTMVKMAQDFADQHQLTVIVRRALLRGAAIMNADCIAAIERACDQLGVTHTQLVSYAGHDAQMLSGFTPTGMIFIPSVGGISHNPKESSKWEDVERGTNVLLHTILGMAGLV